MEKRFIITDFKSQEFIKEWEDATEPNQGNSEPLANILNGLKDRLKSVIFEYEYIDADYQDEFSCFYSKSFKAYRGRCIRIHFFSSEIPLKEKFNLKKHVRENDYLGFMVIRPIDLQKVGRTILQPFANSENPEQESYVNCKAIFTAHILGEEFLVSGMPFMQQDTQVGACAQASLWMLARHMSRRFGYRHYYPSEINKIANQNFKLNRPLPAERGLVLPQMMDALQEMGFPCTYYQTEDIDDYSEHLDTIFRKGKKRIKLKMADIAYRYIESGLPVIFVTADHAFVAIGHTYNYNSAAKTAIQRIPDFIVNNDNTGPYGLCPIQKNSGKYFFGNVEAMIVVTPPEVMLTGELAEQMARKHLDYVLKSKISDRTYEDVLEEVNSKFIPLLKKIEYRTYLMPSIEFQSQVRDEKLPSKMSQSILGMNYPKYVWITEISSSLLLNTANSHERKCLGRIIIDSTAPGNTNGVMLLHLGELLFQYNRQNSSTNPEKIDMIKGCNAFNHKVWDDDHP